MKRYARIAEDGLVAEIVELPAGTLLSDCFHPDLVASMRPVTAAVKVGWSFDGTAFAAPVPAVVDIPALRQRRLAEVDAEAERQRLLWITPGAGQAMTYARKVEEARQAQLDPAAEPAAFPMLAASIGIDGADLSAVAAKILAMDAAWGQIGGAIEARRLSLKRDIAAAEDAGAFDAIEIDAGWPARPDAV